MAEENTPTFQIQRIYLKESSLEQPNSPAILLEQTQPTVDIQLGVEANNAADGVYEMEWGVECVGGLEPALRFL